LRILAIETEVAEELVERGVNGIFTVEPADLTRFAAVTSAADGRKSWRFTA
jgi:hypothetical protein